MTQQCIGRNGAGLARRDGETLRRIGGRQVRVRILDIVVGMRRRSPARAEIGRLYRRVVAQGFGVVFVHHMSVFQ